MAATTRGFPYADLADPADAQASMLEIAQFLDDAGAKFAEGALGARPAAAASNKGTFYLANEGGTYYSNGVAWRDVSVDLSNYARKDQANTFTVGGHELRAEGNAVRPLALRRFSSSQSASFLEFLNDVGLAMSKVGYAGHLKGPAGDVSNAGLGFINDDDTGIYRPGADQVALATGGSARLIALADVLRMRSTTVFGWSSGEPIALATDTDLYRRIAAVLRTSGSLEAATALEAPEFRYLTDPTRIIKFGSGSPEGVVTASPGSRYHRIDAAPWTYIKKSGTGNTGWVADTTVGAIESLIATAAVANTVVETSLYSKSIASTDMPVGAVYRLKLLGDILKNAASDLTLKVKFGATTVLTASAMSLPNDANRGGWDLEINLAIEAAAVERIHAKFLSARATPGGDWAHGETDVNGIYVAEDYAAAAENTATAKTLDVTAQWTAASANADITRRMATLERIA